MGTIVVQVYVDDIIFGSVSSELVKEFIHHMQSEFQISLVGELTYFLGLQVQQLSDGIFVSQTKYAKNIVSKFGLNETKD